ncbi:MAG: hypothetical protein PHE21_00750 [Candidatus Dojkabacteria bacterium]|nr:hypothetical protein [Candidatus Dojkabacteria bacterium]
MYEQSSKNRTVLIVVLLIVLLAGVFAGTYFILQRYVKNEMFLDKHSDVVSLCDRQEGTNIYKCNLLLEDIVPNIEGKTCFDVQIISNETIVPTRFCEEEQYLSLTNDIVQFKKLKPLTVSFTYVYNKLTNISFEPISDTYIQDLVNRDIEEIMQMNKADTTILNSFDFCPKPSILPEYITNKEAYIEYFDKNVQSINTYKAGPTYSKDLTVIYSFLFCESANNLEYKNICRNTPNRNISLIPKNQDKVYVHSNNLVHKETLEAQDITLLNIISLLYDNLYLINQSNTFFYEDFGSYIKELNLTEKHNDILYSTSRKLFSSTDMLNNLITEEEYFKGYSSLLFSNYIENYKDKIDISGLYIYHYLRNKELDIRFRLLERCNNISVYIKNV